MSDKVLEQWINIKFYVKLGKNTSGTLAMLSKVYGWEAMKKSNVSERHKRFKENELRPNDWILHHDNALAHNALSVKQFWHNWFWMTSGCFQK